MDLVNQLPGISCIMVDDKGRVIVSKNIDLKKYGHE
jgi:thiamine biosynthesis lipoprotein